MFYGDTSVLGRRVSCLIVVTDASRKQDNSLKAGCLIVSIYMKSCWLRGTSLVELHVVSSSFPDEVRGRAAAISFFSVIFGGNSCNPFSFQQVKRILKPVFGLIL